MLIVLVSRVQAVVDVLADLGDAFDLACVLASEEGRPCVLLIHLREVR